MTRASRGALPGRNRVSATKMKRFRRETITVTSFAIAAAGFLFAGIGIGIENRNGSRGSETLLIWLGTAIAAVSAIGGILSAAVRAKK